MQERQPGQGGARPFGAFRCALGQSESGVCVASAVQGDVAGAQQGVRFERRVTQVACEVGALLVIRLRGGVVMPLGGVPDKLAHEGAGVGVQYVKFPMDASAWRGGREMGDAVELSRCFGDEAGGRHTVVAFGAVVEVGAECRDGGHRDALGVTHRVVEGLGSLGVARRSGGEQIVEAVGVDAEAAGKARPHPGGALGVGRRVREG